MSEVDDWQVLGAVAPTELEATRIELHHAAQLVAAVGASLLPAATDDSHPNLGWNGDMGALRGHAIPATRGLSAGLQLADLDLLILGTGKHLAAERSLVGRTTTEVLEWLAERFEDAGAELPDGGLALPGYEIPDHPVAHGEPFGERTPAHAELSRWFANAALALEGVRAKAHDSSDVRCWPHHFDIALLTTVTPAKGEEMARTVGVGMTPGDGSYAEPYWYVTPYPYPDPEGLPPLRFGRWHTEGFVAAILTADELTAKPDGAAQAERLGAFLGDSITAARQSLEA